MKAIRVLFAAILFAVVGLSTPAGATSATTDQSDLWWVPSESGWGIQLVQRGTVIFATMFVYGPTGAPTWYAGTLNYLGNFAWTGDLYVTNGPWFGTVPFNPSAVGYRKVGTMTWNALFVTTGTLTYSVDGVPVTKTVTRQTLVLDNFAGRYAGAVHQTQSGCFSPANNGTAEVVAVLAVTQNGTAVSLASTAQTGIACTYSGTLSQAGQMGEISGAYSCSTGETGTFTIFEVQVNVAGITGRLGAHSNTLGCSISGWFGGMRGTTF